MVPVSSPLFPSPKVYHRKAAIRVSCFSTSTSEPIEARKAKSPAAYEPRVFDNLFLSLFRNKMIQETGWDSKKPGYDGLIEVAHRLTVGQDNAETRDAATFFKDHMGVPLLMEPNFTDYSCQFKFGILPPQQEVDDALKEPCLAICPNAVDRKEMNHDMDAHKCPKA